LPFDETIIALIKQMTAIIPKLKKTESWLACIALIAMVIVGVIFFHAPYFHAYSNTQIPFFGPFHSTTNVYDDSFIQAVSNISNFVPRNETLVVTASSAVIKYFSGHPTKIPWKVNSYPSLVQYMSKNNFTYIVVPKIRGTGSSVETLKPLFTTNGLQDLKKDFQKIGDFKTQYSRIFLYKKIG
jgi:hypothetical protein